MKITSESELMKNQKHADLVEPDLVFEVLQTTDGDALFFSLGNIGTDRVFYVTRELRDTRTGWKKIDLSTHLSADYGGATVAAKSFAISQNPQTLHVDLALVLTVAGVDYLYLSLSNSADANAWADGVKWTSTPFDAAGVTAPQPLTIADVYIMSLPAVDGSPSFQNCFVDILRTPGDPLLVLDRYFIQPGSSPQWIRHEQAADLAAGSISSCLGHRTNDWVPGIYTFGTIANTPELLYAPQYNVFRPNSPPNSARLTLPAGTTSISSALDVNGNTNLFVAATAGIFLFTPDNQNDLATPSLIVPPMNIGNIKATAGASQLAASTTGLHTVLWGIDQGNLFHVYCPVGQEATASAWSTPIPLCSGVETFAFYLNALASNNIVFAHLSGKKLVQLTQDPITTSWTQRSILLPPTSSGDFVEYNCFTSRIIISDDNSIGMANTPVSFTSISPITVYINDVYCVLSPNVPVTATSDMVGAITVVQETKSLSAVCYQVSVSGPPAVAVAVTVNPLSKAIKILSDVKSGDDLSQVQIKNAQGTVKPLVPSSVSSGDKDAAAKSLTQLIQINNTLPADGSPTTRPSAATATVSALNSIAPSTQPLPLWGVSFGKDGHKFLEGDAVLEHFGTASPHKSPDATAPISGDIWEGIEMLAGDLFGWLWGVVEVVEGVVIQVVDGVYHFFAKIEGVIYKALLDCVSAVLGAVEFIFGQILVLFEDFIDWLGYILGWSDILRTHRVLKNVIRQYVKRAIGSLDSVEDLITASFDYLENNVNAWADITDPGENIGTMEQKSNSEAPGTNSPQSNWALTQTQNNISSATTTYNHPDSSVGDFDQLLKDLEELAVDEFQYFFTAIEQIKTQVAEKIFTLTPLQVIKALLGIITDLVLKSARNFIGKMLDIMKIFADQVMDMLDAPLDIPILSYIYKLVSGDELTCLDLVCLICSISATIVYKLVNGQAPYPDDSHTQAMIDAQDFDALKVLVNTAPAAGPAQNSSVSNVQDALHSERLGNLPILDPMVVLTAMCNFDAVPASALVILISSIKFVSVGTPSTADRCIAAAVFPVYCAPDIAAAFQNPGNWVPITNDAITGVAIVKTIVDNLNGPANCDPYSDTWSPVFEFLINLGWLAPAIGGIIQSHNSVYDWTSLASNLCFDVGGILVLGTVRKKIDLEFATVFFVLSQICGGGYGGMAAVAGSFILKDGS